MLVACLLLVPATASALEASLGDSYSSGEGAGSYDFPTKLLVGNGCHRSSLAWPRLLSVPERAHFACSGATTDDFFDPQKEGLRGGADKSSQLSRLRALAKTDSISRVFVTIGGNDLGFGKIILACLNPIRPCLDRMDDHELQRLRGVVFPKLIGALTGVRLAAGDATIVLVGYPDVVPPSAGEVVGCGWWLEDVEVPRIGRLETELDRTLAAAAATVGVEYLSIRDALDGHELCSADPWINPLLSPRKPIVQEEGHPDEAGQRAIAEFVSRELKASDRAATLERLMAIPFAGDPWLLEEARAVESILIRCSPLSAGWLNSPNLEGGPDGRRCEELPSAGPTPTG
jgi:hypothetical protein